MAHQGAGPQACCLYSLKRQCSNSAGYTSLAQHRHSLHHTIPKHGCAGNLRASSLCLCRLSSGTSKTPCTQTKLGKETTTTQVQPPEKLLCAAALRCLIRWHACLATGSAELASCLPKSACQMMLAVVASEVVSRAVLQGMPLPLAASATFCFSLLQLCRVLILFEQARQQPQQRTDQGRRNARQQPHPNALPVGLVLFQV